MGRFKNSFIRFFSGRYGADALYYFTFVLSLLLILSNVFVRSFVASLIIYAVAVGLLAWATFRSFSRNIYKRRKENETFIKIKNKIFSPFVLAKNKIRDRKTHKYIKCKKCRAVIRVKRIPGEHFLHCPKCSEEIKVKIKTPSHVKREEKKRARAEKKARRNTEKS